MLSIAGSRRLRPVHWIESQNIFHRLFQSAPIVSQSSAGCGFADGHGLLFVATLILGLLLPGGCESWKQEWDRQPS